jgi:hypothetical protein
MPIRLKYLPGLIYRAKYPRTWLLADPVPGPAAAHQVVSICASGPELGYLFHRFRQYSIAWPQSLGKAGQGGDEARRRISPNFPDTLGNAPTPIHWFGDEARFIVANL